MVLEAEWNWGSMYDWLARVENVVEVQLAHPNGVRAIAAVQVKTDRIDARMLGQLLRVGLIKGSSSTSIAQSTVVFREVLNCCIIFAGVPGTLAVVSVQQEARLFRGIDPGGSRRLGGLMTRIGWVEGVGYLASLLVFCTFYMKTMVPLRGVAIASNLAFLTFGLAGRIYPVLVLHAVLLPLNFLRLRQMQILIRRVREASRGNLSMEWLIPLMTHQKFGSGHVLFKKGDPANSMYLVLEGSVRLVELDVALGPGTLVGEIGVFAPDNRRTGRVICESDVEIRVITDEKALQLYYQNPTFGFYMFRLVLQRMLENERLQRA